MVLARPHRHRDRAPPLDHPPRRPHHRAGRGRIVEEGTHDALLLRGGHYAHLYNTYFRHQSATTSPAAAMWRWPRATAECEVLVICHVAGDTLYSMLSNSSDMSASADGKPCDNYFESVMPA